MSGIPYLRALRKSGLVDIADEVDFSDAESYNKNDLVVALDKHLRDNQTIFSGLDSLSAYYSRLDTPRKGVSPAKRNTRTPGRPPAKKEPEPKEESSEPEYAQKPIESPTVVSPTLARSRSNARQPQQTPKQSRRVSSISVVEDTEPTLPASPAVVTEVIDHQTTKIYEGVQRVWTSSGFVDQVHSVRENLSSLKAIETIILLVEGITLIRARVPIRYLTTFPAIRYTNTPPLRVRVPDLFQILDSEFWVPLSIWVVTCFLLPLLASYFINLSWKAQGTGRRTRSSPALAQFDPLIFNIAKALLVHIVLGQEISFGLTDSYNIKKVKTGVHGGEFGLLTGAAIGAVGAIYEAILTRA
ncbi:hypothetical protein N7452_010812 [Penicillium brevicompactum]|uniref:Uncharacterized protein n=1 Tax=Penicillium brevicompactum TaxID=5074 RepID=A0A9W9Q2U1_PENBR|nr:hypothetical protein N7452_010812 [Penicillium brevicompactum]